MKLKELAYTIMIGISVAFCMHHPVQASDAKKVVFLTGAAGFIGSNFLKHLFDAYPNYQFIVLDALTYAGNLNNIPREIRESDRFKFVYGSVNNYVLVDSLMRHADFVVHFAAESHVTRSIFDDALFFETDVLGTRVMMANLVKYAKKVERFIHISTSEVLGTAVDSVMDESHPLNPRSPYAAAKAGADRLVYAYWCTYDVPALIIRPFNNYGPHQHLEKMIPRFITSAIKKEPLTIHGTGEQKRDWVHTKDVARALDLALHIEDFSKIKNQVIHIGSGAPISVIDVASAVLDYFGEPRTNIRFVSDRPGQVECHISSTKKSYELLGWKPQISFKEGLVDVIEWYKKNRTWWDTLEMLQYVPIRTDNNIIELQ